MYEPRDLIVHAPDPLSVLDHIGRTRQLTYLRDYLRALGTTWALEEPYYFDRDYLSEFAAFYSSSARGYPNVCRRLHFFSGPPLTRSDFLATLGDESGSWSLQDAYLGFVVIRPIPGAPLGRTVLKHYPDRSPERPRILTPARDYAVHIAGLRLRVRGLAWAQQDAAVSACATIALWTMFHSSAFDEHHAIPTTAAITMSAHRSASLGSRIFPSEGLNPSQIGEAIKEHGLIPLALRGPESAVSDSGHELDGFSTDLFSKLCSTLIRSGYPVLIGASRLGARTAPPSGHAVCLVGFRSWCPSPVNAGDVVLEDSNAPYFYIHDDNIGPNVRHRLCQYKGIAALYHDPPGADATVTTDEPPVDRSFLVPKVLIVGLHEGIRLSSTELRRFCEGTIRLPHEISKSIAEAARRHGKLIGGIRMGVRILRLRDYLGDELDRIVSDRGLRARLRADLTQMVQPMSLHVTLIRLALSRGGASGTDRPVGDDEIMMDVLYDTTDSKLNASPFASIIFDPHVSRLVQGLFAARPWLVGKHIICCPASPGSSG